MSSPRWMSLLRRVSFLCFVAILAVGSANAQSSPSSNSSGSSLFTASESSSNEFHLATSDGLGGTHALSSAVTLLSESAGGGAGGGAGQEKHGWKGASHGLALEFGGGFNAPIGNDTPYITWGGNLSAGAGLRFSRSFSLLGEFQFLDNKLPGAFIAAAGAGATGGDAHIIALTAEPVFDFFPKRSYSAYLTGGGGYYHKSTNFTVEVCCDFSGYPVAIDTNSFTSNQGGLNLGFGITHRLGGTYGDSTMKLFAEARYLYLKTPPITQINGLGTTELIPVTLGMRW